MITSLIALAMLAAGEGQPPAKASNRFDPNRVVCKYSGDSSSRIARRKECQTAAEWAERRRLEQQYLRENQRNGAK
jgi:hypothetical protein